jgi:hypothetical protein
MHVNLVIATPGHSMISGYVKCLMATMDILNQNDISVAWTSEYSSNVSDAREVTLAGTFQNSLTETKPFEGRLTYDKILWIDSDITWEPEDVLKLYNSDKDIISGAYLIATGDVMAYKEKLGKPYSYDEVKQMTEPVEIYSAGFGFICFKSGIFEKMPRPWFQAFPTETEIDGKPYVFNMLGEDISLCHRAKSLGFQIWLDPTVKVTHHKTVKLTWEGVKP